MERRLGKITLLSNVLTHGHCPPQLLGNGRGDRLRSGPDRPRKICGAAGEAEAGPRLWPELALTPQEKLPATLAKVLIKDGAYHRRRRSTHFAVSKWEDSETRGGMQPPHMPPRWTLGKPPKLMLGRVPLVCRTDPLSARNRAEVNSQERNALLVRRLRTSHGPLAIGSKGKEVSR